MKKALLVDDDYLVRSYLKMLPSWEKAGFSICADVRDGEEALELLKKEKVDLVVTDLEMPLMDGIRLIREIRKTDQKIHIIVLSCHDDFEHVKQAMKEGADEYVLKNTLDEKSLYSLLGTAMEQMQKKKETVQNPKAEPVTGRQSVNEKYLYFNQILAGTLTGEERERERIRAGVKGVYQNSAVIVMKLEQAEHSEDPWAEIKTEQYCLDFLGRFRMEWTRLLAEYENEKEVLYLGNGVFSCFVDLSGIHRSSVMQQILTSAAAACYKICRGENRKYAIGVSSVCIGAEAIRQAYQQARLMVKMCFYEPDGIAYYENGKCVGMKLPEEAEYMLDQMDVIKYRHDRDSFQRLANQAVCGFERELTEERLVIQWLRKLRQISGIGDEEKHTGIYDIGELSRLLEKTAQKLFEGTNTQVPEEVSNPVRIAGEYVAGHFREPIGLNDAAAAAGVNSTYLSYLFSQEMGIGFAGYLMNLRLEYARKLLGESSLKMREVAEKSGFHDYHYFSKVFKKTTGVSPAEYRKTQKKRL